MLQACRVFDVYSLNVYATHVDWKNLETIHRVTGRPILVGEFHFGVPGRGLAPGLVQARDQAERGAAYRYYVEQAAAYPAFIGTSWFQWVDQPCTGRMDGENYNIGLVDVTDRPYGELIDAMKQTHRRLQGMPCRHDAALRPQAQSAIRSGLRRTRSGECPRARSCPSLKRAEARAPAANPKSPWIRSGAGR